MLLNWKGTNPSLAQLENDRNRLLGEHGTHIDGIAKLIDQQTWLSDFHRSEHTQVWPMMTGILFTQPGGPADGPVAAVLPADGPRFDHRLMVPLASYTAESYLACIRGISPEYRTTGDFRDNLRNYAQKIDVLAQNARGGSGAHDLQA